MVKKFLVIGIGIAIAMGGIIGWYSVRSQKISGNIPQRIINSIKTSLPINHKQRLAQWSNFANISTIDECLLTNNSSCFPTLIFTSDAFGGGKFTVKMFKNQPIDKATIRSILLANTNYQDLFLTLPKSKINSSGFYIDDVIDISLANNLNPLASWIILDSILNPLINVNANLSFLEDNSIVTLPSIAKNIGVYFTAFSSSPESTQVGFSRYKDNPGFQQLLSLSLSPMQKAIIFYFYTFANKEAYLIFMRNFPKYFLSQVGVFPLERVKSNEEFQYARSVSAEFIFCNQKNEEVLRCANGKNTMKCYTQRINKICQAQYFLLGKEP